MGGYRSWLADRNMSFRAIGNVNMTYNPLNTGQPRSPQRYNGQRPTLNTSSQNFEITYRMDAVGLPDTMLFFGMNNTFTSFYPNGPSSNYVRNFGIYQTFLHGKLTVKAGITPNYYEYVGMFAGGSPILSAGIPGLLPVQAGLGADPANVPLINVTGYGSNGKYIRVGVQRSTSVRGLPDEVLNRRGRFFNFTLKDAGPLYIGEIGVRRPATFNSKQIWLRAGGFFNDSRYRRFDGRGTSANASIYAAADRQITQPDQLAPGRGVYVGASAFWIPQSVNSSTKSIEARVYSIGMAASRPKDTLSLRFIWTQFSDDAREAQRLAGMHANRSQVNASLSYSARLTHGVYATPGLTYVHNPSFVGDFKDAAVMSLAVFLII
ncbi:carbohydrate porin [Novosphingobium sp. 11B]